MFIVYNYNVKLLTRNLVYTLGIIVEDQIIIYRGHRKEGLKLNKYLRRLKIN